MTEGKPVGTVATEELREAYETHRAEQERDIRGVAGHERGAEETHGGRRMKDRFADASGDPRREALVRQIEGILPDVPVRELMFAARQELLRRELAKLEKLLKEQGL